MECEIVVNAAGIWAPRVSAMVGAFTPSIPVDHQHIALKAVPGHELPRDMPCFRDTDNLVYGKAESGGVLFGGYESNAPSRWEDGAPWEHGGRALPADEERFAALMAGAVRRFPFLADAGVAGLVCHPDAMTPDANPLLGPMPGVPGFWMAAGLSLNGFGGAGGIGKAMAEWITTGETEVDVSAYRAWRFGDTYRDVDFAASAARETYRYYYRLRYPLDADEWGRPQRTSALYGRLQEQGAVLGSKNGWERADYFQPGRPWRRAGADQRAFGWMAPPYLDRLRAEHTAFRERAGIIDMTSFGKTAIEGPGALRAAGARLLQPHRPAGRRRHLHADARRPRRHPRRRHGDAPGRGSLPRRHRRRRGRRRPRLAGAFGRAHGDAPVSIRDASEELSVIGLWGPAAREILQATTDDDVSGAAFGVPHRPRPPRRAAPLLAQRITYVGELGYELYVEPRWAVQAYDLLVAAGAPHGLEPCGYRSLEGLRMEKGYRYYGTDLTPGDTPDEAGLGVLRRHGRPRSPGARPWPPAATEPAVRRIRTLLVGGSEYRTVYGGEAVHHDGVVVGRLRSASYGFTVERNLAYAYLPVELQTGDTCRRRDLRRARRGRGGRRRAVRPRQREGAVLMATFTNWVGNQSCSPAQIVAPASEAEVQEAVRDARQVRCVAAGHSFTPVHLTDGTLLTMDGLHGVLGVDAATGRASALPGTTVGALGLPLWDAGFALGNQGDIDTQGIAGAIGTCTHGSGPRAAVVLGVAAARPAGDRVGRGDRDRRGRPAPAGRPDLGRHARRDDRGRDPGRPGAPPRRAHRALALHRGVRPPRRAGPLAPALLVLLHPDRGVGRAVRPRHAARGERRRHLLREDLRPGRRRRARLRRRRAAASAGRTTSTRPSSSRTSTSSSTSCRTRAPPRRSPRCAS